MVGIISANLTFNKNHSVHGKINNALMWRRYDQASRGLPLWKGSFSGRSRSLMVFQCNCMRCRRLLGTVAVFVIFDDSANVQFSGETSEYVAKGESGLPVRHYFCPVCGTMINVEADAYSMGGAGIILGAFDDPHQFEPE